MNLCRPSRAGLAMAGAAALLGAVGGALAAEPHCTAEVRRTSFGFPHVKSPTLGGAGFGIGYAFAQDNYCQLADMIVPVNGERSKYFGPRARYDRSGDDEQQQNLRSEVYHKYLNEPAKVRASWARQPAEVQALVEGYAAGFNRYRREVGAAGLPEACRNQPWLRDITALDLMRLERRYAVTASVRDHAETASTISLKRRPRSR